ncbi:MAG TPA: FtsX-like permease family protein [Longimicrobiales bacterium]|nr:FtsX-like permease family protein [Longimicrobiales bacterium]
MSMRFLGGYALRSLRRGGQRSLLAVVCIAFGVLALVAMQLLANVVGRATNVEPHLKVGGDLAIRGAAGSLTTQDSARLAEFVRNGALTNVTMFSGGLAGMVRSSGSGRVQFVGRTLGVDPATFPLVGEVRLSDGGTFGAAVARPGSIVLTRDLATALAVKAGDTIRYGDAAREPARLVVGGVAEAIPDRRGQSMLYSLATADILSGDGPTMRWAAATAVDDSAAAVRLTEAGLTVSRAVDGRPDSMARVFGIMLRGAGLLGLIIGGIGIAYTLQVMLTRRRMEIATLRAMGYRTHHLVLLFGFEAAMLGAAGGVLGAALAIALSAQLVHLLDRTAGALMLEYSVAPELLLAGPLIGVATAVLFGTAAILRASAVRPGVLLRDLPVRPARGAVVGALALNALLAFMFTVLAGVIMRSFVAGAGVVALAALGTLFLGAVLIALLWLVVRLPMPHLPLINMARANLRSRQVRSAFSLIALFVGVFSIGFAAAAMTTGRDRVASRRGTDAGLNMRVYAAEGESAMTPVALRELGAGEIIASHEATVRTVDSAGARLGMLDHIAIHDDKDLASLVVLGPDVQWQGDGLAVLVPDRMRDPPLSRRVGERLTVTSGDRSIIVHIAGFYVPLDTEFFSAPRGMIAGAGVARALGIEGPPTTYLAALPEAALDAAAPALGQRLPGSLVVSRRDINDFLVATYQSLFMFVIAVAGLALLAGGVLIANAVSLAMVERRRELGVLMAVGYTSRRVLRTILLENGALGLVAGIAGIAGVRIVVAILNARESSIGMEFGAGAALALLATSVLLAMLAAGAVAWAPVHVRPLEVLRDE